MSVTYTDDTVTPVAEDAYVPSYARRPSKQKKVRAWMVLAPVAAVVLIGGGAVMLMNSGGGEAQPLAEPDVAAPVSAPMVPAAPAPVVQAPMAAVPVEATAAPVVRDAAPVRAPVARRESAPVRAAPRPTPRVETVAPTGPQPYGASSSLNTAPPAPRIVTPSITPAPAPTVAPAPVITVQPLT